MQKTLTLSIVIPTYNEEDHIEATLDAISHQTIMPNEVIVVDNNSTDKTIALARKYPFVRILKEKRQGRAYARTTGFNTAASDIIGRIDADSVLEKNWAERVIKDFSDPDVMAVTGLGKTNISILPRMPRKYSTLWSRVYYWNIHTYFRLNTMWGANMALRQTAWQKIKNDVCLDDSLAHEDEDVSILIASTGGKIIQDNDLLVTAKKQSYHYFPKLLYYSFLAAKTKRHHKKRGSFAAPTMQLMSLWQLLPGFVFSLVFGVPFYLTSILYWPIDAIMIRRYGAQGKRWLD